MRTRLVIMSSGIARKSTPPSAKPTSSANKIFVGHFYESIPEDVLNDRS